MVSPAITSLAILKVNWDTFGKDYIENFVPFVAQCIISMKSEVVSVVDVQTKLEIDFGIRIPQNALKTILNRAANRSYVIRQHGAYVPNQKALATLDFESTKQRVLREHNATIGKLIDFCDNNHSVTWDKDNAEKALLSYIADHQVEILTSSVDGSSIPRITDVNRKAEFLVNAFIIHLCESDPEGFKYLDTIVKGSMLANVLWYPDISRVTKNFELTEVYCDTAFLIRAIGLEGPRQRDPCKELIDLLYEKRAELRCFRHTMEEIINVLQACIYRLKSRDSRGSGRTLSYLIEAGYTPSDLELEIAGLEKNLSRLRIKVVEKPEYVGEFQIDEKALEQALEEEILYGDERQKARIHDVDCLSAIYRIRKGRVCYYIENCAALFLTTNIPLCKVSWQFFNKDLHSSSQMAPIAITDHLLTTLLWLKKPTMAPNLPLKHIIADCYAAMEPSDNLWKKYLAEISKLQSKGDISSDDYYFLRASLQARTELMSLTKGDEYAFVEGTPKEILERIKRNIKAEETAKIVAERNLREQTERELEAIKVKQKAVEQARQKERDDLNLRLAAMAQRIARYVTCLASVLLIPILSVGAYASFPGTLQLTSWSLVRNILTVALIVFLLFGLGNYFFGVTVKGYLRLLEVSLSRSIETKLKRWFLP